MIYQVKVISGHQWVCVGCVRVCVGVYGCVRVCKGVCGCGRDCTGVHGCALVCVGVYRCVLVGAGMRESVFDEFSEYLQETRVLISADFNSYPIQIFL